VRDSNLCQKCENKQDRQVTYNITLRRVSATIVAVEKQWVLHNLCVLVALVIQHAMRMRHVVPAPLYNIFPHYLINGTISEKKVIEQTICVSSFSTNFV
jgi:hypothetical protein